MIARLIAVLTAVALSTASAAAQAPQPWTGPDLERRGHLVGHARENFETAITEICFPYILQSATPDAWRERAGIAPTPARGVLGGLTAFQVGGGASASVGVGDRGGGQECTIEPDLRMDPDVALETLSAQIARMPMAMTLSGFQMPTGRFARRFFWCGPATGPQIVALVSMNTAQRRGDEPALIVSFLVVRERDPRCDVVAR